MSVSGFEQIVATVGKLDVPQGAVNVIPGLCEFTLDLRAADNRLRDAAWAELEHELQKICQRRDCDYEVELLLLADAVSCEPAARQRWAAQLQTLGRTIANTGLTGARTALRQG